MHSLRRHYRSGGIVVALGRPALIVYALAAISTVVATLYLPAHSALLPSLCRTGYERTSANAVRGFLDSVATLAGPLLAAVLLKFAGVAVVLAVSSGASLAAAALLLRLRHDAPPRPAAPQSVHLIAGAAEGVRAIVRNRGLALLDGLTVGQKFTRGALTVFTVVVALDLLHTGEPGVGTLTAAIGAGAVIGSLATSRSWDHDDWLDGLASALPSGAWPIALIPLFPRQAAALILLACVGLGNAFVDIGSYTLMARLATDDILAHYRCQPSSNSLAALSQPTYRADKRYSARVISRPLLRDRDSLGRTRPLRIAVASE